MNADEGHGYERSDASAKLVIGGLAGLLGLIAVAAACVYGMSTAFQSRQSPPAGHVQARPQAGGPRLEIAPRRNRIELEADARARLAGYGWRDRSAHLARIPIARAMELQARTGWPDAGANPP